MKLVAAFAAAGFAALLSTSADAQVIGGWQTAGQWDRGGDYRCDAYWDANRTDCDAAWRTPRRADRYDGARHRPVYDRYGYGRHDGYGRGHGYGHGGYAQGYGHAYQVPATAYQGAYGRPDLVYGGGGQGYGYGHAGRDPGRIDWCRRNYRSYDVRSGYYRAYSGRLVWCG